MTRRPQATRNSVIAQKARKRSARLQAMAFTPLAMLSVYAFASAAAEMIRP